MPENPNNDVITKAKEKIKEAVGYEPSNEELDNISKVESINKENKDRIPPTYSYVPKLTAIFSDGKTLDLLDYITIIQLEMNFVDYIFPLFSLQLLLPTFYIPKIQFDDNMEFKLELMYKSNKEENPLMYDTMFEIILKKTKQISSPVNVEENLYEEQVQYMDKQFLELKLVPKECLEANKFLFSGVYSDCSVLQAITLMTTNLPNKLFIQQPDNIKEYDQIIFTPNNVFYSIQYLENFYGLYDRGLKMFYGFNLFRVQSKNFYDETGTNKVKVAFSNETESPDGYSYIENGFTKIGNDNLLTITPNRVKIYDRRHYNREIIGTNINTFSRDDDAYYEQIRSYDYDETNLINKTKAYINNYNNNQKEKEFLGKTIYTKQLELILDGIILDVPSWFKLFKVNFDSSYYERMSSDFVCTGYYWRLTSSNIGNSAAFFSAKSIIELQEV